MSKTPVVQANTKTPQAAPKRAAAPQAASDRAQTTGLVQRAMDDPALLTAAEVVSLQRQVGNSAVQWLLTRRGAGSAPTGKAAAIEREPAETEDLETETEASSATDVSAAASNPDDNESTDPNSTTPASAADAAAPATSSPIDEETVSRQMDGSVLRAADDTDDLETQTPESAASAPAAAAPSSSPVDEEMVSRKEADSPVVGAAGGAVAGSLEQDVQHERGAGQGLPDAVRGKMESAFDADFSSVKLHTDGQSDSLNRSMGARAFTTGQDVFFKGGEYNPASRDGQTLLAHELTHVIQQGGPAIRRERTRAGHRTNGAVQRQNGLVQRFVGEAHDRQRQEWKGMSTWGKMAMVPGGAAYGAAQGAASGYQGIYGALAGKDPGKGRKFLAGLGAFLGGTAELPFTLAAGALKGAYQGIANPIQSVGKRIRGVAGSEARSAAVGTFRGGQTAAGQQVPDLHRGEHALGTTNLEVANYAGTTLSTAAAGARSLTDLSSRANAANVSGAGQLISSDVANNASLSGAGSAFLGLGGVAGVLGAGVAVGDAAQATGQLLDSSRSASARGEAGLQAVSSTADAVKQSATAAYNIGSMVNAQGVAAAAAQVVAGGAAAVMGAIDMLRGTYGVLKAKQRKALLLAIAVKIEQESYEFGPDWQVCVRAAKVAAATQDRRKDTASATIAKGALSVAGGIMIALSAATPVGWALLAGAALIGGIAAIIKWKNKRSQKRQIAVKELGIIGERAAWKVKRDEAKARTTWGTTARREAIKAIGPDPLRAALQARGYKGVDHFYTLYITQTADTLYLNGVQNGNPLVVKLIEAMGFKVDSVKKQPTAKKIAQALDR